MSNMDRVEWQDGVPVSRQFGDVYFSSASGLEETRHVFLQHNRLRERFAAAAPGGFFTIGETGFGTGLNFLCAWQLWDEVAPAAARLHFVSVERYPLSPQELQQALALWPVLQPWAQQLLAQYRLLSHGWHRFTFALGRVSLTLIVDDIASALPQTVARIDAWFLDGFAPARNPQMWTQEVLQQVARLAPAGATFATFTSAGEVRRTLTALGFQVEKVRGFGSKREMLCGVKTADPPLLPAPPQWPHAKTAAVIGAGIAGASVAHALAQRGWRVTVIERHPGAAGEASGNPLGILYPRLSHKQSPLARLIKQGFQHSVRQLNALDTMHGNAMPFWHACGVLQLAFDAEERERIEQLQASADCIALGEVVERAQASVLAGIDLPHGGMWLPQAGWVKPAQWCEHLLQHPGIAFLPGHEVGNMAYRDDQWEIFAAGSAALMRADVVVVCTANAIQPFPALAHLPVKPLRGQMTQVPVTPVSAPLKTVICGQGYLAPALDGWHALGASFDRQRLDTALSLKEQQDNLTLLHKLAPEVSNSLTAALAGESLLPGRAALRATSPDFMPMAGAVCGPGEERNLHASLAHGARGLITAPLIAEIIASQIEGEPAPAPAMVLEALSPQRFAGRLRAGRGA